jgi:succinate dehydrogenase / fumarate reductase, cytochrome b subunit
MATTTVARGAADGGAARAKRKAPFPIELYRSALGKKYIMAITGIMLMGFVFAHMVGNLKIYSRRAHRREVDPTTSST